MQQVNILMPIHNRWKHTEQSLKSLLANTDPELAKITIVNDLSDDSIHQALDAFWNHNTRKHRWELYHNRFNIGPGPSRNFIADALETRGEKKRYIYHSDNDVFFTPGWLERLIKIYEDLQEQKTGVLLLGGGCHPYLKNNSQIQVSPGYGIVGTKDAVSGYSQLMTWETWKKYGPFDESMKNAEKKIMGSEDYAFCQKIIKDGFLVGSIEPEVVYHTGKTNTYKENATGSETFKESTEEYFVK